MDRAIFRFYEELNDFVPEKQRKVDSVFPVFESLNIDHVTRLRKTPLRRTKFIADVHLGDIVKLMRALGFDVYFDPTVSSRKIIESSQKETRIILTKSKKLLKFKKVTHGILYDRGQPKNR